MKAFHVKVKCFVMTALLAMLLVPYSSYALEADNINALAAPATVIKNVSPANGQSIDATSFNITFGVSLPLAETGPLFVKVDDQLYDPDKYIYMHGAWYVYVSNLPIGTHSLTIRLEDDAGNLIEEYTSSFITQKPLWNESSILMVNDVTQTSATLSWPAAEASLGYQITSNGVIAATVSPDVTSVELTNLQPGTTYEFQVKAKLLDGRWTFFGLSQMIVTPGKSFAHPSINSVSPANGEEVMTALPKISAKVYDEDSDLRISSIIVRVDDQIVSHNYDEASKILTASTPKLANGRHSIYITALDNEAHYNYYLGSFIVNVEPLPSNSFLERFNKLHDALAEGDPTDVADVRKLRTEIVNLDASVGQSLIDPVWNKISSKLPTDVDQAELKSSLFKIIQSVGSLMYDSQASDLEAIRKNAEFQYTLNTIAEAGGESDIKMDDFLAFMFGDGDSLGGMEGTVREVLSNKSAIELFTLLGDSGKITEVLIEAMEQQLSETNDYKFSSMLNQLGVTPADVRNTVLNFQQELTADKAAIHAMAIAYIRSEANETVEASESGRQHVYTLDVLGIHIPALVLRWTKVSGSSDITVQQNGIVTIPEGVATATAVIQASLINPYGGANKVIFQKEVTLTPQ